MNSISLSCGVSISTVNEVPLTCLVTAKDISVCRFVYRARLQTHGLSLKRIRGYKTWYTHTMFYLFLFIFGTAIGSFLNVLIDRLPNDESIMGRSHCDYCRKKIAWYDLIPIISFIVLGGTCRNCRKKLSFFYPAIEFLTGISFVLVWKFLPYSILGQGFRQILQARILIRFVYLAITACLIVIFFSDYKYHIIPDQVQIALFALSLFLIPFYGSVTQVFVSRVIAAILVSAPILFLYHITRGGGMGFGDVKLSFIIGLMFGIKAGLVVLYIAFVFGAIIGLLLMLSKKRGLKSKIAFGPFLVTGMFVVLFWRDQIFALIKKIYGA